MLALLLVCALLVVPGPAVALAPECAGVPATMVGTPRADVLVGTPGDDVINAAGGADRVYGGGGDDLICGGPGRDRLLGEEGNDRLVGGGGADRLFGGPGAFDVLTGDLGGELLDGGPGQLDRANFARARSGIVVDLIRRRAIERRLGGQRDRLRGVEVVLGSVFDDVLLGDDEANVLAGAGGDDFISGGEGVDLGLALTSAGVEVDLGRGRASGEGEDRLEGLEGFVGGSGADHVTGAASAETLVGGLGPDRLLAGGGADALFGGWGTDQLDGGPGRDRLMGGRAEDQLVGGAGFSLDVAAFGDLDRGVFADLHKGYAMERVDGGDRDRLSGLEGAQGTKHADVLLGDPAPNSLQGGAGADDLRGYAGDDYLYGGRGDDRADGLSGVDTCNAEVMIRCERPQPGGPTAGQRDPATTAHHARMGRALDRLVERLGAEDGVTDDAGEMVGGARLPGDVSAGPSTCVVTTGGPSELTVTAPTSVGATDRGAQTVFWQPVVYRWAGSRWERFLSQRYWRGLAFGPNAARAAGPLAELVGEGGPLQAGPAAAWRRLSDDRQAPAIRLRVPPDSYYTVLHYVEWVGAGGGFLVGEMRSVVAQRDGALTGPALLAAWCRS